MSSPRPSAAALPALACTLALVGACASGPGASGPHRATPARLLPPVTLPRFPDEVPVDLRAERGRVLVLDFWATWCEPCKAALPEWDALAAAYRDRGVQLYAVSVDADLNKVAEFLGVMKLEVPVLLDRDAALAEGTLKLQMIPTAFIVDRKGVIRNVHQGYGPGDVRGFAREIDPLLDEK